MNYRAKLVLLHLPLIGFLLIILAMSVNIPLLDRLKTEFTYGYWVVIVIPVAVLLLVIQISIWLMWLARRSGRRRKDPPSIGANL